MHFQPYHQMHNVPIYVDTVQSPNPNSMCGMSHCINYNWNATLQFHTLTRCVLCLTPFILKVIQPYHYDPIVSMLVTPIKSCNLQSCNLLNLIHWIAYWIFENPGGIKL